MFKENENRVPIDDGEIIVEQCQKFIDNSLIMNSVIKNERKISPKFSEKLFRNITPPFRNNAQKYQ